MTETTTLTGFLLARIGEDEAELREEFAAAFDIPTKTIRRRQAECEAKRRIVEWAAPVLTNWPGAPDGFRYVSDDGRDLLLILALPYAGHPDYQQGWRL